MLLDPENMMMTLLNLQGSQFFIYLNMDYTTF